MAYILSLLATESPTKSTPPLLCYHINDTCTTQIVRVMRASVCHFERIIFAGERILFEAFPDSYLEISSSLLGETLTSQIACRLLQVSEWAEA
ncbi:DUF1830 domain-containing protein [Nodosilinea sp. E11]|uniref:DUF1830 domain-containing protein n=1 Tax=Nodosilinea sp. E11 TaxID=3037479 RepID=UPI0029350A7C|nr:DUF1830 domain-containing protein [Nodosilinea sp. E11]WOD39529.1 DUF1830 domain-containing protein [Nodosilinea sp. E11]